jgi:DNA repair protein RadC
MDSAGATAWERVKAFGFRSASVRDLLAVALSREQKDVAANEKEADQLLRIYGPARLSDVSRADLLGAAGLEGLDADRILAAIELGRKCGLAGPGTAQVILGEDDAYQKLRPHLEGQAQEKVVALFLNAKGEVITEVVLHVGTLTQSTLAPRDVFREALRHNAASVIVGHNHPSGDPEPSPEDIQITRILKQAGDMMDVVVLDHLIVGQDRYTSLRKRGYL